MSCAALDRCFPRLAGANADDLLDVGHEYLAVADLSGPRCLDHGLDGARHQCIANDDLDLDLGQEVHDVFGAAVQLGMPLLATETLHFGHSETRDTEFRQGFAYFIELERLDDRFDFFHRY